MGRRAVLDALAQVMTSENFNGWLASTCVVHQEGEVLRVAVPAAFNKTWLSRSPEVWHGLLSVIQA